MTEPRSDLWTTGPGPDASASTATRSREAAPAGATPRRPPARPRTSRRWLVVALALVTTGALALGLARCGAQRDAAQTPAPAAPGGWSPDATIPPPPPGTLEAGTTSLF
jgi:hypothetical protein